MADIEHWPTGENDMVPGPAYDRMRADRDHWREETAKCKAHHEKSINKCREHLEGAVEERDELVEQLEQAEARYYAMRDDRDRLQVLADALKRGQ